MIDQGRKITWPSNLNFNKKKNEIISPEKVSKIKGKKLIMTKTHDFKLLKKVAKFECKKIEQ